MRCQQRNHNDYVSTLRNQAPSLLGDLGGNHDCACMPGPRPPTTIVSSGPTAWQRGSGATRDDPGQKIIDWGTRDTARRQSFVCIEAYSAARAFELVPVTAGRAWAQPVQTRSSASAAAHRQIRDSTVAFSYQHIKTRFSDAKTTSASMRQHHRITRNASNRNKSTRNVNQQS
jgi:hypothetical protein